MIQHNVILGALIGSRICHDLVSPVGAISNGLELLGLAGVQNGPEMALVADSAANANARLRFFRVAFGLSRDASGMSEPEIRNILDAIYTAKIHCAWQVEGPLPRRLAQAAFLALLCGEQAVPFGGTLTVSGTGDSLRMVATGARLTTPPEHWGWLTAEAHGPLDSLPPAQVQFALLPELLSEMGRHPHVALGDDAVTLAF